MKRLYLCAALAVVIVSLASVPAYAADAPCALETGLDPTCVITSNAVNLSTSQLNDAARSQTFGLTATRAWNDNQEVEIRVPVSNDLHVASIGNAYGAGDLGLGYSRIAGTFKHLAAATGIAATVPTGAAAFSSGRTLLSPWSALSYRLGGRASLVMIGSYGFDVGGTKLPYAPRTQTLTLVPRAIVNLTRSGIFTALDLRYRSMTGEERYQAYSADMALGVLRGRYRLSLNYAVPINTFTRQNIVYHTLQVELAAL